MTTPADCISTLPETLDRTKAVSIFWFRRDLRISDNQGLKAALSGPAPVLPIFIFDSEILRELPTDDARVHFIHQRITNMKAYVRKHFQSDIALFYGNPITLFDWLADKLTIQAVYTNKDYEPYARARDEQIAKQCDSRGIAFHCVKDQVIFEQNEIVKKDGKPYTVYTPYMKQWRQQFDPASLQSDKTTNKTAENKHWLAFNTTESMDLDRLGFKSPDANHQIPLYDISDDILLDYATTRDIPALDATSHLGPHLRFGTISIRHVMQKAIALGAETFQNELIWREFFMQILWHFPETVSAPFKPQYGAIVWDNDESKFQRWCQGNTGYPLVDAGMRELNQTGYMHNRVRMLVASFLCKHLLIDWRWGEAYFAEKLNDYEQASNVGNWQWAAGCGVDAAPYFRIFNPTLQAQKFDSNNQYISRWVPEFNSTTYPNPIVDHKIARENCLKRYKTALEQPT